MIRRSFRIGLTLGVLGGLAFMLAKLLSARSHATADLAPAPTEPWPRLSEPEPAPTPAPAVPGPPTAKKPKKAATPPWVEPTDGVCPTSHPVKAKLTSKIFHLPGMINYERTKPDRCYVNAKKAEADGLRPAKR